MEVFTINNYRGRKIIIGILITLGIFITIHYHALRSYVIMFPYSYYSSQLSQLKKNGYFISIPSYDDQIFDNWYPGTLVFHDDHGFGKWVDKPVELTVLYRFGGFKFGSNHAAYFNHTSNQYSSFYGAYIVNGKDMDRSYGFNEENKVVLSDIMRITEYDQRWLVMPSIGLDADDVIFQVEIIDIIDDVIYSSDSDLKWTKVNAYIRTNSPAHEYKEHQRGYYQYGIPVAPPDGLRDYYPITLAGRIYVSKNETDKTMIALYILAVNFETVDQIDKLILSNTTISKP